MPASDQEINAYCTDSIVVNARLIGTSMINNPGTGSPVKFLNVSVNELFKLLKEGDLSFHNDNKLFLAETIPPQYIVYPKQSFQDIFSNSNDNQRLFSTNIDDLPTEKNTIRANLVEAVSSLISSESTDITDSSLFLELTISYKQIIADAFQYLQSYILSLDVTVQVGLKQKIYIIKDEVETLFDESNTTESIKITLKDLFENLSSSDPNCYITTSNPGNFTITLKLPDNIIKLLPEDFASDNVSSGRLLARRRRSPNIIQAVATLGGAVINKVENYVEKADTVITTTTATVLTNTLTPIGNSINTTIISPLNNGFKDITSDVKAIVNKSIAKSPFVQDLIKQISNIPNIVDSITNTFNDLDEFGKTSKTNPIYKHLSRFANKGDYYFNAIKNVENVTGQICRTVGFDPGEVLNFFDNVEDAINDPQSKTVLLQELSNLKNQVFREWSSLQDETWFQCVAPIAFTFLDPFNVLSVMLNLITFASSLDKYLFLLASYDYNIEQALIIPDFIESFITLIINFVSLILSIYALVIAITTSGTASPANQASQSASKEVMKQPTTRQRLITCFLKIDKTGKISILNKVKIMLKIVKLFRNLVFPALNRLGKRPDFGLLSTQQKIDFIGKEVITILLVCVRVFETDIECVILNRSISYPLIPTFVWDILSNIAISGIQDLDDIIINSKDWFGIDIGKR